MEKENDKLQDVTDSQLLREELLDLEDVDALLEQVMKEAEEQKPVSQDFSFEDEEFQQMDAILENASQGVPLDDEILSMLQNLDEEDRGSGFADSVRAEAEKAEAAIKMEQTEEWADSEVVISFDEESADTGNKKKEKKKKEKKEKKKKEKIEGDSGKQSFWSRILAFVFEPAEDENEEASESGQEETEGGIKTKASKKPKKEKKQKGKKNSAKPSADDNAAIAAELSAEDKKNAEKKKKKEKTKKEKRVKDKKEEPSGKSGIGPKGTVAILLVCFSLLGMILAVCYALPSYLSLQAARKAFYEQNYEEALHRFYGNKLNSSDEILYKKALVLNALELSYEQYEIYKEHGTKAESINALFEGYKVCQKKKIDAEHCGVLEEWNLYRERFLSALLNEYGVSEEAAEQISVMNPLEYTIAVDNLADGLTYDAVTLDILLGDEAHVKEEAGTLQTENESGLEDLLPEEKELLKKLEEEQKKQQEESSQEIPLYEGDVIDGEVILY